MKVIFHKRLSSNRGCLPPKVIFHQRSSSNEVCLQMKVVFHRWSSSSESHIPPKVVYHWKLSSNEGGLPPKVVFIICIVFLRQYICGFCGANPLYALSTKPLSLKTRFQHYDDLCWAGSGRENMKCKNFNIILFYFQYSWLHEISSFFFSLVFKF